MAAQPGRDMLLKIYDGSGFVTVGGLRSRTVTLNAELVDITDSASVGRWREALSGAGTRRVSITGAGVFKDDAADARIRTVFFDGLIEAWQIILPSFGTLQAPFHIGALDYAGEHDGALRFDIALESAGAVTFTATP